MPPTKSNNVWKKTAPEGSLKWHTLPSGQTCQAKRTGLSGLVMAGVLSEGDDLMNVVDRKHIRRVRGGKTADRDEIDAASLVKDPAALAKVIMIVDRTMPYVILDPPVKLHFADRPDGTTVRVSEDERDTDAVYTDQIGFEDKMYLFNWAVGGTGSAARFRRESENAVATVEDGSSVRDDAE